MNSIHHNNQDDTQHNTAETLEQKPELVKSIEQLRSLANHWQRQGKRVALVPTMGNLHQGHLALVELAKQNADVVLVSIFVNPLQFGKHEDFDRYPRSLEQDLSALTALGVDVVFAPSSEALYPSKHLMAETSAETTAVVPPAHLVQQLCGLQRQGHFTGVATIVLKLLLLSKANVAIFGQKDYQQVAVIQQMVADLNVDVELITAPTTRAEDGLALSSRNQYLSPEQRMLAPRIYQTLLSIADRLQYGSRDYAGLIKQATNALKSMGIKNIEYLEIRHPDRLAVAQPHHNTWVILIAVKLGHTRLIDNLVVTAVAEESTSLPNQEIDSLHHHQQHHQQQHHQQHRNPQQPHPHLPMHPKPSDHAIRHHDLEIGNMDMIDALDDDMRL